MKKIFDTGLPTRLLAALLALALNQTASAAERWYQIELLLFLNPAPGETAREFEPIYPELDTTIVLQQPREQDAPYALLPREGLELTAHRLQMNRSGRYETLLHLAWRQPVADERQAQTLSFRLPAPADAGLDDNAFLKGTLRMSRGRYLHADLDASYLPPRPRGPISPAAPGAVDTPLVSSPMVYRLVERRRMRSDELHYLDSPGLGALIIARPYRAEGAEPEEATADQEAENPEEAAGQVPPEPN